MKRSLKKGLPGGPNEKVFSKEGYRSTSPDVNNLFNFIPSGNITMKEKDGTPLKKGPLLGIDNLGNSKLMLPGANYQFPGDVVKEVPLAQKGGLPKAQKGKATQHLKATKPKPVKSPCSNPITTVINNVPEKIPFGKKLVGTDEKTLPVSGTKKCEYVKTINPIYEDIKIEPIELQKSSVRIDNVPLLPLQMHDYTLPDPIEAPQYTLDPYTADRLRLSVTPGKRKSKKHSGRLMDGKGQRYKHTTYKRGKDLEFGRKEVTKPIAALVQKLTGYDPKYFEGYEDEEGNFVPGELDYGNATGSEMEFRGAASLRDFINQQKYKKEYEEYDKNLDTWLEQYEQSKKKQAEGQAFKKGGPFQNSNIYATNKLFAKNPLFKKRKKGKKAKGIYNPKAKYTYDDGGESGCPEGFYNDPVKGCVAIEDPSTFYENWYKNRVMPTAEGQKLLDKIRPEALERASQNVPYIYSEELNPDEAGYYDTETQQIILNKDLPEAQIEATKLHEFGHHIQAGDKFYDVLGKPHQYLVEQNVVGPKEIDTGNPEWDKNLKKNYDDVTNPDEIHARIMTLRNECGFKPDQVITEKDIEDCFKRKKEAGEALDPDIEDLKGVTKGNQSIVNLLNDMVSVPTSQDGMLYAKNGGAIEIEIDESDIDKYVKGGYVVEDISVPSLTRMQFAGEVPDSTYTPIDPNFLAENPDTYSQIVNKPEVTSERQGSDIGKLRAEFREKNPMDIFLDEKKRQFLKKNKGLNKAAGNTMEKFPEDVLQNFIKEYEYKTNNYAVNKLGKKEGWNPKRRGEWVDELTPGEKDAVAESKYGSKLQPSYWSRSLAGLQELGNEVIKLLPGEQGDVMKFNIPGLTKKEQKEIRESKLGALETLAPMDIPGAAIANLVKNTGLSTGSDYKEQANVLAGEKMANVSDTDAMALNPLTYAGLEAIPELGVNLVKGIGRGISAAPEAISNLKKFITTEAPLNLDVPVNKIDNVVDVRSKVLESVPKDAPYVKPNELLPDYTTFKTRGQSITYDEGVDLLEDMAKKYPVLQESPKVPVYYHGTTSASLPGIIKGEGLTPVGELIREGKVPLTGELGAGVAGINNSSISTAMARGHQGALDYAIGLSGKNKVNVEDDLAKWFERGGRESFVESPFSPDISFYDDLKNKRLTEWQNLSDAEKALVQDNYPVMFGINPTKGNAERFTIPRTDISDEVGISGKINFEEIPSIFVPKNKVAALQEQLGTKTKVLPIEDFMQDYKNAGKYDELGYNIENQNPAFKSEIDWRDWVKNKEDFDNNPNVIQELNDIEKSSKEAGTWMKNADGTPFQGTPEQFIVQQSTNWKNAFPEYYGETLTTRSNNQFDTFDESKFGATDEGWYGKGIYTYPTKEAKQKGLGTIYGSNEYDLYVNSANKGFVDEPLEGAAEMYQKNTDQLFNDLKAYNEDYIKKYGSNELTERLVKESYDDLLKKIKAAEENDINQYTTLTVPSSANETVIPFSNRVKSAKGNILFDMTNPNMYKAMLPYIIPAGLGVGAASQMQGQESNASFKEGGIVSNLTKKEIDKLIKQGYIIEEID
jgi:hypothetical protein